MQAPTEPTKGQGPCGSHAPRPPRRHPEPTPPTSRAPPFTTKRFHVLLNSLFKVLFSFPSRYLFAIGLVPVFSFRRSLPPVLGCIPKQPDSEKAPRERAAAAHTGFSPSTTCRSKQLYRDRFAGTVLLETTIRRPQGSEISSLSSSRFTRRYWGNPC